MWMALECEYAYTFITGISSATDFTKLINLLSMNKLYYHQNKLHGANILLCVLCSYIGC